MGNDYPRPDIINHAPLALVSLHDDQPQPSRAERKGATPYHQPTHGRGICDTNEPTAPNRLARGHGGPGRQRPGRTTITAAAAAAREHQ